MLAEGARAHRPPAHRGGGEVVVAAGRGGAAELVGGAGGAAQLMGPGEHPREALEGATVVAELVEEACRHLVDGERLASRGLRDVPAAEQRAVRSEERRVGKEVRC